ncbi:nitrate- and nitrite sensing domain-containing protein [Streptomyces sp. NPDC056112]|uniref:sensor histidine kinase n=1 Tax=Streptomyces sp. NPDC056112 TaxID=3345715 RepID=UPI0035D96292
MMSPQTPPTGSRRRLGSIRLSLVLLALVPTVALAAMWGVTTTQMFSEGLRLRSQTALSRSTGAMGTDAALALQQERGLSAAWLASPHGSRAALDAQRVTTDKAVAELVGQADSIRQAPARIKNRMYSVVASVGSLEYYRGQVDKPTDITGEQALDQYTAIIDDQIHAFQELSQVDDGDLTSQAGPLVALEHAAELVSQEDAQLTLAWSSKRMDQEAWDRFAQLVHTRRWLVEDQIVPSLQGSTKTQTERILQSAEWRTLEAVEDQVLSARGKATGTHGFALPDARARWGAAVDKLSVQYSTLIRQQTASLLDRSADRAHGLLLKSAVLSAAGLAALVLCVGMSWRITRSLSRRLLGLRIATLRLAEERLPDVVARLERGEKVDVDSATPPLDYGTDELGQVAQAFNTAQRTAVHTAVELADTRRGFQKVILGIARQSQNLINLQLSKLDALERRHQDPEVLQGLYELDSTASQLRRYEENLVIISGEQPRRSWTEPVALIDILRGAVGEVAEYQRVEVHTDEEVYLAPPAVADVIHLLAELIDNATAYSAAPSPVGVRAAMVAKGLVIEVEDRGLGMSEEDYAQLNAHLAVSPQFDVVALADDLRLGMFVIARLATRHGITVTLRSSPYGGTTAIVLVPHDIVVPEAAGSPHTRPQPSETVRMPGPGRPERTGEGPAPAVNARRRKPSAGQNASRAGDSGRGAERTREPGLSPLPRRVPQTSLAAELRGEAVPVFEDDPLDDFTAERAASSLAGFQRGTREARHDDTQERADDPEEAAAPDCSGPDGSAPDSSGPDSSDADSSDARVPAAGTATPKASTVFEPGGHPPSTSPADRT